MLKFVIAFILALLQVACVPVGNNVISKNMGYSASDHNQLRAHYATRYQCISGFSKVTEVFLDKKLSPSQYVSLGTGVSTVSLREEPCILIENAYDACSGALNLDACIVGYVNHAKQNYSGSPTKNFDNSGLASEYAVHKGCNSNVVGPTSIPLDLVLSPQQYMNGVKGDKPILGDSCQVVVSAYKHCNLIKDVDRCVSGYLSHINAIYGSSAFYVVPENKQVKPDAKSATKPEQSLKRSEVKQQSESNPIPLKPGEEPKSKGTSGTGFFVTSQGHVLTNSHVASACKTLNVLSGDVKFSATLISDDKTNDIALLKVKSETPTQPMKFSGRSVELGETIYAIGYPLRVILSRDLQMTSGNISGLSGINNDYRFYQLSAPVQPGNSGGPLVNSSGQVVGMVTSKLNSIKIAAILGDIPQNINFAIKSNVLTEFLEAKKITYTKASDTTEFKGQVIAGEARKYTVLIECD